MRQIDFSEIEGIKVGHAQDLRAATGCTVIISEEGATVGVDVRGGASRNQRDRPAESGQSGAKGSRNHSIRRECIRVGCYRWSYAIS